MVNDNRRSFFGKITALSAFLVALPKSYAQETPSVAPAAGSTSQNAPAGDVPRRGSSHTHNGIYYFSGTGANDGYPKDDRPWVERASTRTKRSTTH